MITFLEFKSFSFSLFFFQHIFFVYFELFSIFLKSFLFSLLFVEPCQDPKVNLLQFQTSTNVIYTFNNKVSTYTRPKTIIIRNSMNGNYWSQLRKSSIKKHSRSLLEFGWSLQIVYPFRDGRSNSDEALFLRLGVKFFKF